MAARSRCRSPQAAGGLRSDTHILDLPHEVLVQCLGSLQLKPRLRSAALVCKRFAAAACSPELLRKVDAGCVRSVPDAQSLTAWLARHGQHLQRLQIACSSYNPANMAAVAACLETAGTAGQLIELSTGIGICSTEWLAAMPSLRRLKLSAPVWSYDWGFLQISPAINGLTALEHLDLEHSAFELEAGVRLPASITRVKLSWFLRSGDEEEDETYAGVLSHIAQLPQLARLELSEGFNGRLGTLSQLSRLSSSLTRLDVLYSDVPPSLAALTRLQHLRVQHEPGPDESVGTIETSLPQLTQLTCLVLHVASPLPDAVADLPNLQRCCSWSYANGPLPVGPWLHSLRWLGVDLDTLARSLAVLRSAPALELLDVTAGSNFDWGSPAAVALVDWLAQHPPLRRICFEECCREDATDPGLFDASIAQLRCRRPGLLVQFYNDYEDTYDGMFLDLLNEDCP